MLKFVRVAAPAVFLGLALVAFGQQQDTSASQDQNQDRQENATQEDSAQQDAPAKQDSSVKKEREAEVSSSKDTRVDLSPPPGDEKKHPQSGTTVMDAEDASTDVQEMNAWDPHKAAKDVEVGDFYY